MRHRRGGRRFDMPTSQRRSMFRNLTTDVLRDGYVQTTEARAKELRSFVEKMITLGKRGSLHDRRRALAFVYDPDVVSTVFSELAERYSDRPGGYTRVIKLGRRKGDGSRIARIELV